MNTPESNNSFELPAVSNEALPSDLTQEFVPSAPEKYTKPAAPSTPQPQMPIAQSDDHFQSSVAPSAGSSMQSSSQSGPVIADDNDLIEKEWVVKAKQIVAATKEDPYRQNQEISKFRADYLKKRYNKNIKTEGS